MKNYDITFTYPLNEQTCIHIGSSMTTYVFIKITLYPNMKLN